jgi:hypothetical protein
MDREAVRGLARLLRGQRLVSLAVVAEGRPVAGLLPFLAAPDLGALVVHASGLARHSAGLGEGRPWSGVVHEADDGEGDALQVPRVVLEGASREVPAEERGALQVAWLARFPSAELTVGLPDFRFFRLEIAGGRLVAGFGRAFNLSKDHLAEAAALG